MDRGRERERERGRGRERNRGYVCACLYQMTKILVSRQSGIREDHQASRKETPDYSIFCETTPTKNIKGGDISKVKSGKHNQRWFPPFLSKPARTSFRIEIAVINH
jgi:hypothetical protein